MTIEPGLEASAERHVAPADTARQLRSGDLDVLGTPAVVALCEEAAVAAVTAALEPTSTTVGVRIDVEHIAPTLVGGRVVARARLTSVNGRTLHFEVEASDDGGPIARGTHIRVVVDRDRFMDKAGERHG